MELVVYALAIEWIDSDDFLACINQCSGFKIYKLQDCNELCVLGWCCIDEISVEAMINATE